MYLEKLDHSIPRIMRYASKDMTGSKIVSVPGNDGNCHPVAVFSGSGGIRLCRGDGGEYVHQQVFPAQAWGTRYLTYHTINNTNYRYQRNKPEHLPCLCAGSHCSCKKKWCSVKRFDQ